MAATITGPFTIPHGFGEGGEGIAFKIVEDPVAAGTEYELEGCPTLGRIVAFKAELTGGAGATIQPEIGLSAGWTVDTIEHVATTSVAAAFINDVATIPYVGLGAFTVPPTELSSIWIRSVPDAGADNTVETFIVFAHSVV
jgi:hypothetical protein